MKYLIYFILFLTFQSYSQEEFIMNDFSDEYYIKIKKTPTEKNNSEKEIKVYNSNNKLLITDSISAVFHPEKVDNKFYIFYDSQEKILFEDINFDGKEDFIFIEYPNFRINPLCGNYLYTVYLNSENKFIKNEEITKKLNCKNLEILKDIKRINLYDFINASSLDNFYRVENNKLIKETTEIIDQSNKCLIEYYTKNWESDETQSRIELNKYCTKNILSFTAMIDKKEEIIDLFINEDTNQLYFTISDGLIVEKLFPEKHEQSIRNKKNFFHYDSKKNNLYFFKDNAKIEIKEIQKKNKPNKIKLVINDYHNKFKVSVKAGTIEGSLKNLSTLKLKNVINE